nr:TIGR04283 family arsenosugar biosynthesis glycosyltransferase [Desulfobulbaceae bacterium]
MTLIDQKISNISVIIPCRNEEANIAKAIQSAAPEAFEIIVVDSGNDSSARIASQLGCNVLTAPPGRASQMNAGATAASGEILLFLHSDTVLPTGYSVQINKILRHPNCACGAFQLHINQSGLAIRLIELCTNIRAKLFSMPYGDQAIFIHKSLFDSVGGYRDVPFLEDVLLIKTMQRRGTITLAKQKVTTSGRRWQRDGVLKTTLTNRLIMLGFLLGASPERLQHCYRITKK